MDNKPAESWCEVPIVVNSAKLRRETHHGRQWLIAPLSMIVDGVLNGSRGPGYYPPNETKAALQAWDGMPITVNHPFDPVTGNSLSAKDDGVLNRQGIGTVLNPSWSDRLVAEGWFDDELTQQRASTVHSDLIAGRPIELSTGLRTRNDPTAGVHNGVPYTWVARDHKPDHLAVLVGQTGACSRQMGCGVNNADFEKRTLLQKLGDLLGLTDNAGKFGNPQSKETGLFKRLGSGTGKGETHEAAQRGAIVLTDHDKELGATLVDGVTPAWASNETQWLKARTEADKGNYPKEIYGSIAAHIYGRLGGKIVENCGGPGGTMGPCPGGGASASAGSPAERHKALLDKVTSGTLTYEAIDSEVAQTFNDLSIKQIKDVGKELGKTIPSHLKTKGEHVKFFAQMVKDLKEDYDRNRTTNQQPTEDVVMSREQLVNDLVTNCDCWKGGAATLNTLTDEQLKKLKANADLQRSLVDTTNQLRQAVGAPADLTLNAMPAFIKAKIDAKKGKDDDEDKPKKKKTHNKSAACDEDSDEYDEEECAATENSKPITSRLNPQELQVWNAAVEIEAGARQNLVIQLVANIADAATKQRLVTTLNTKSVPELRDLLLLQPAPTTNRQQQAPVNPMSVFFGAGAGVTHNARLVDDAKDDVLDLPTMNFAEIAAEQKRKQA